MLDQRLSVHDVSFLGATPKELCTYWRTLGVSRLSLIDSELLDPRLSKVISTPDYSVETVYHLFRSADGLRPVIDAAAAAGARAIYMLTGGRGESTWEQASERFCEAVQPCLDAARQAGVALAIENASALYADIHIAHTLRDTIELAERADLDICIDLFHCWTEAQLPTLLDQALPRTQMIQLSDYVLGDRSLPARAVPGDGSIPIERFVSQALAGGYRHGFDLELIGPRIEQEGRLEAAQRGCEAVSAMLERCGTSGISDVVR